MLVIGFKSGKISIYNWPTTINHSPAPELTLHYAKGSVNCVLSSSSSDILMCGNDSTIFLTQVAYVDQPCDDTNKRTNVVLVCGEKYQSHLNEITELKKSMDDFKRETQFETNKKVRLSRRIELLELLALMPNIFTSYFIIRNQRGYKRNES